ncbi:MAG: lytic transglycosylase domain-containing protein [Betaproteobacteria bacterium]|nr:MAG: lytic transglycosylase domain-containing protein [Betaproteobacteria bacterium]
MDNLKQFAVQTYTSIRALLHNGLAVLGAVAVIALLLGARPVVDQSVQQGPASAVFGTIRHEGISLYGPTADAESRQNRALAVYLSRRYKVALDATEQLVGAAHEAGSRLGMDPLLILAVMAVESRFNPIAESVMGAKGLMQVIPKFHQDKLEEHGGEESVLDPMTNILVGTRILKDAMRRGGGLMPGLQLYAGAFGDDGQQYAQKVIAEKERMQQTLRRSQLQPRA